MAGRLSLRLLTCCPVALLQCSLSSLSPELVVVVASAMYPAPCNGPCCLSVVVAVVVTVAIITLDVLPVHFARSFYCEVIGSLEENPQSYTQVQGTTRCLQRSKTRHTNAVETPDSCGTSLEHAMPPNDISSSAALKHS